MPSDDRDQQFERALARQLRGSSPQAACPDAEILAAYHERTLSLNEMAHWKLHISACSRCQETLSLLEQTESVTANEWEMSELPAGLQPSASWHKEEDLLDERRADLTRAVPAPSVAIPKADRAASPAQRRAPWRFFVPVGALAAGLLVWVAVHERSRAPEEKSADIQVAENRQPAPQNPPAPAEALTQQQRVEPFTQQQESSPPPRAKTAPAPAKTVAPLSAPASGTADALLGGKVAARKDEGKSLDSAAEAMRVAPEAPEKAAGIEENKKERAQFSPPPSPAPATAGATAVNRPAGEDARKAAQNQLAAAPMQSQAQAVVTETVEVTGRAAAGQTLRELIPETNTIILAAADGYAWRVGTAGKIERSTDGGRTWTFQKSGVANDLSAGAAPSGKVCWVVGKAGTVLLTSDGGRHWKQLASPTKEDLVGVDATDAKRASIWNVSHTKSFQTNDGGVTWTPFVNN